MDDDFDFDDFEFSDFDDEFELEGDDSGGDIAGAPLLELIEVPKAPPAAGAIRCHPLFDDLVARVTELIERTGEVLGEVIAFDDVIGATMTKPTWRPACGLPQLVAAEQPRRGIAPEQLSLFDETQHLPGSDADLRSSSPWVLLGAILLDHFDWRERHLGAAAFNESIELGSDPVELHALTVVLATTVSFGATIVGTNMLEYFRQLSSRRLWHG